MQRRNFFAVVGGTIAGWLGLSSCADADGPVRRLIRQFPLRRGLVNQAYIADGNVVGAIPVVTSSDSYTDAAAIQNPGQRWRYNSIRSNIKQVEFAIWVMVLIWVIELIIEWLLLKQSQGVYSLVTEDRSRVDHAVERFEVLKSLVLKPYDNVPVGMPK